MSNTIQCAKVVAVTAIAVTLILCVVQVVKITSALNGVQRAVITLQQTVLNDRGLPTLLPDGGKND